MPVCPSVHLCSFRRYREFHVKEFSVRSSHDDNPRTAASILPFRGRQLLLAGSLVMGFLLSMSIIAAVAPAHAAATGPSGLPLPRFVSLKADRVNMRVGPGRGYQVEWLYLKRGLPMEVIQEFDNWRKVRDSEGNEGWILHSLLSGKRTAIVAPWEQGAARLIDMMATPSKEAGLTARVEPGVVAQVSECEGDFCLIEAKSVKGYVARADLWGVYPDETVGK